MNNSFEDFDFTSGGCDDTSTFLLAPEDSAYFPADPLGSFLGDMDFLQRYWSVHDSSGLLSQESCSDCYHSPPPPPPVFTPIALEKYSSLDAFAVPASKRRTVGLEEVAATESDALSTTSTPPFSPHLSNTFSPVSGVGPSLEMKVPSPSFSPRVSTQSSVFTVGQSVNLRNLALYYPDGNIVYDPKASAFERRTGRKKTFGNQASLMLREKGSRVSISACIFCNGTVKLAGCKSLAQSQRVADTITSGIKRSIGTEGSAVENPDSLTRSDVRIVMTKADFDLGYCISLDRSLHVLSSSFDVKYDPSNYCGLIVSVPVPSSSAASRKPLNVMLFSSGKAFSSGSCVLEEIAASFSLVKDALAPHEAYITGPPPPSELARKRKTLG